MLTSVGVPVQSEAEPSAPDPARPTLLCFSHLRWDFVFQRPQHLMSRFARTMSVVYWEEPVDIGRRETPFLKVREAEGFPNVRVVTPHLPEGMDEERREAALKRLLDAHVSICTRPLLVWYYTPMMLAHQRPHRVARRVRVHLRRQRARQHQPQRRRPPPRRRRPRHDHGTDRVLRRPRPRGPPSEESYDPHREQQLWDAACG